MSEAENEAEVESICAWISTNTVDDNNIRLLVRAALEAKSIAESPYVYGSPYESCMGDITAAIKALQVQAATGVSKPNTSGYKHPPEYPIDIVVLDDDSLSFD